MKRLWIACVFILSLQAVCTAKPGDEAIKWALSERNSALGSVAAAEKRVEAAESDLRVSRSIEQDIRTSKDSDAMAVAREAVSVSEQGLKEADTLLKRARELLSKQEKLLASIQTAVSDFGGEKAMVIPVNGEVRRTFKGSEVASDSVLPLRVGEKVDVGANSSAKLFVARGDAEVDLHENSSFTVTRDDTGERFEAMLSEGLAHVKAKLKYYMGKKFEVRTPAAICAVRGTDFSIRNFEGGSRIEVFEGTVSVRLPKSGSSVDIHSGEGCTVLKDGGIQPVQMIEKQGDGNVH
ncbi:FecR domain-containing protein [Sulfuricurvum sp.]|uniref:FecR domain-containing protein n=1 Tax=Sulfuricurvum sp. TaxID=2025608 RepID=UPI003BAE5829